MTTPDGENLTSLISDVVREMSMLEPVPDEGHLAGQVPGLALRLAVASPDEEVVLLLQVRNKRDVTLSVIRKNGEGGRRGGWERTKS